MWQYILLAAVITAPTDHYQHQDKYYGEQCEPTKLTVRPPAKPINDYDISQLRLAMDWDRCRHHHPKSPCFKEFIKLGERNYYVVCGEPVRST